MRASLYLIGFAAASIVGAGAAEIGCSSSSGGSSTPPEDAATPGDTGTTADTGAIEDAGGGDAAPTCVAIDASAATIVTGSPVWDCYEAMCGTALTECAADCTCNDAVLGALQCTANDAGSQTVCFAALATAGASPGASMDTLNCLVGDASAACQGATAPTGDGGGTPDAAPAADAGDGG
jgi:hypothetical protein